MGGPVLTRRILALVALALAPALAIQGYNEYALRAAREASVRADAQRGALAAADDLVGITEGLRQALDLVAQEAAIRDPDPAACAAYLRAARARLPGVALLALAAVEGPVICDSRGSAPGTSTSAGRPHHQRALATGGLAVGDYTDDPASGRATLPLARAVGDAGGAVTGVLTAAIDLSWLAERLARSGLSPDTSLGVIDARGRVLVRVPGQAAWAGRQVEPARLAAIQGSVGGARDTVNLDGRSSVASAARPGGVMGALTVTVGRDRELLFADIDAATWRGLTLILVGAALALAAALAGGRAFIRRPVRRLLAAAGAWRGGDLSARTALAGVSEFGQLGEAFDGMATVLQGQEGELRSEIARSRTLQEQQTTMLHELNHRVKNTLATVQSLARQARAGENGAENLERRILALSRTHDLLTRDDWTGASLRELLENELGPYRGAHDPVVLDGPDLALPPRYVLALGMTVHELTTNAARYGALSTAAGRVRVTWGVAADEPGAPRLRLAWEETGGPAVAAPGRRGFGTRLIAGGVPRELGGEVALAFEADGLRCRIDVPLERPAPAMRAPGLPTAH